MNNKSNAEANTGIGALGVIAVVLVAAKAFGFADYSWWITLVPLLVVPVITLIVFLVMILVLGIRKLIDRHKSKKNVMLLKRNDEDGEKHETH